MNIDKYNLKMIQEFSDAFGPSGFEDDVLNVARTYASDLGMIEEICSPRFQR